ncbi:MAG: hypothetical protein ACLQFM_00590 [Terriglobales bacterium]
MPNSRTNQNASCRNQRSSARSAIAPSETFRNRATNLSSKWRVRTQQASLLNLTHDVIYKEP